ncbi:MULTISPECIES: triose-phosphate isomerase [unclassified Oceanispirochaeta]|uniref:triose-phosphate isomerase n=1 Tax=unclassified Oceanispirochaeta TaxID=2635722 RepID=UPI000E096985|nr:MULTISPECIES: triose-phosphate isomerase [unclassified Oceanispirochaeta]MBF9015061.1 triose-phosphate isomerase [Oceanispirochaeta sp. M2]NPD71519.1 triose-phosphate isomerase [Oceanispirochaeta sp. M1]RDG33092.1 triose-phosphate isomerase [Oceanispirochaeta sp. M1]
MRNYLIAGNWKMNKTPSEASALAKEIVSVVKDADCRVMVAPSFVCIPAVVEAVKGSNIIVAAQNMAGTESGAFTGETSVLMLKDLGVEMVLLGHSERRHVYGETNEMINEKVKLALVHGVDPVLCIGELLEEREAGKAEAVCFEQLEKGLAGVSEAELDKVVIAYEPVWAIGTGKTATPEDADSIHAACRKKIADMYSDAAAEKMVIQYGGSMNPGNVKNLMSMDNIDGGLIGGASLKADSFAELVNFNK